ncbi:MAG: hypothetical protein Q8942_07065 [Bacillota bacterium]|nr:hypothetical protein [Bacillota bacterium]
MEYKMKVEKIEYKNGFKVIHRVPDVTEEERENIKQEILQKMYNDFIYQPEKYETNSKVECQEESSFFYEDKDEMEI